MSLLLKITLSVLTILFINGCVGIGLWLGTLRGCYRPLIYTRAKYALVSMILMAVAVCYIPFMFIWHLY